MHQLAQTDVSIYSVPRIHLFMVFLFSSIKNTYRQIIVLLTSLELKFAHRQKSLLRQNLIVTLHFVCDKCLPDDWKKTFDAIETLKKQNKTFT